MKTVDCRGMSCPRPVLETKKAMGEAEEIMVLVDNPASRENVRRFAESQGFRVDTGEEKGAFAIHLQKKGDPESAEKAAEKRVRGDGELIVFLDSDTLGRGSEELGRVLMRAFLHTLGEAGPRPAKIIFINNGVKLACEGSDVLEDIRQLSGQGVGILSCGTCLDYFHLKEKLQVGKISNMYEILNSLTQAGKVLKM